MPKFATLFPEPSLFPGYPISLGFVVDSGYVGPLYAETRYYDIAGTLLEITSQPIQQNLYGQFLHATIAHAVLKAASYAETDLQDTDNAFEGIGERYIPCPLPEPLKPRFNTMFPTWQPVKFRGYPMQISLVLDSEVTMQNLPAITETIDDINNLFNFSISETNSEPLELWYERKYLDINREVLGIITTLIPESAYGNLSRFAVPYICCPSAVWVQCTIVDTDTSTGFECPEIIPNEGETYEYTEQEHNSLEYN